jgi:hypothetical protein
MQKLFQHHATCHQSDPPTEKWQLFFEGDKPANASRPQPNFSEWLYGIWNIGTLVSMAPIPPLNELPNGMNTGIGHQIFVEINANHG